MIFSNSSSVNTSALKPGSGLTDRRLENSGLLSSPEWVSWKMKSGLGVDLSHAPDKFGQGGLVLGHDEQLVHARAVLIRDGDRLQADHARFAFEQVLIALVGQIGRISIRVGIVAFHRLAEEAVLAVLCADLDG